MPIIINVSDNSNGAFWTKHLSKTKDIDPEHGNDRVTFIEKRGLEAKSIGDLFFELFENAKIAIGKKKKNDGGGTDHFLQANFNPIEKLTPEQWEEAFDILEARMGLKGRPRFIVEHEKNGRVHRHGVWSLVDPKTNTIKPVWQSYFRAQKAAEAIEIKLGLEPLATRWKYTNGYSAQEMHRRQQGHLDPRVVSAELLECWDNTKTGQKFKAAVEAKGYVLSRGDRKDVYMIVDRTGGSFELRRALRREGKGAIRAATLWERMKDVPLTSLPYTSNVLKTVRALLKAQRAEARQRAGHALTRPSRPLGPRSHAPRKQGAELAQGGAKPQPEAPKRPARPVRPVRRAPTLGDITPDKPTVSVVAQGGPAAMWEEYRIYKAKGMLNVWRERWKAFLRPMSKPGAPAQ